MAPIGAAVGLAGALVVGGAARADWPTHRFEAQTAGLFANLCSDVTEPAPKFGAMAAKEARVAAAFHDSAGFAVPRLNACGLLAPILGDVGEPERHGGTIPGKFQTEPARPPHEYYELWLVNTLHGQVARYVQNRCRDGRPAESDVSERGYLQVSLAQLGSAPPIEVHRGVAHELDHAVQFNSPVTADCSASPWLTEALADGAAFLSTHERVGGAKRMGPLIGANVRSYGEALRPTPAEAGGPAALERLGYPTGALFYWAGLRYGGADYLASLYDRPLSAAAVAADPSGTAGAEVKWLDAGLTEAPQVRTGLDFVFPQFVGDYGSWRERFFTAPDVPSQEAWLAEVFGGPCEVIPLEPPGRGSVGPYGSATLDLDRIAARCVEVRVDVGFPDAVRLDTFAYVEGPRQHERLDSIHLSVVTRQGAGGDVETCEEYSDAVTARVWPICVVKPFLRERGDHPVFADADKLTRPYAETVERVGAEARGAAAEGTTHVRLWDTEDYVFDEPGMSVVFALSNVAPDPGRTQAETVTFVAGVRTVKIAGETGRLGVPGPPRGPSAIDAGLGAVGTELAAKAMSGAELGAADIAAAVAAHEPAYATYGMKDRVNLDGPDVVAFAVPVVDGAGEHTDAGYQVALSELPPLGATGSATATVFYYDGTIVGGGGPCGGDRGAVPAEILESGLDGVTFRLSTPISGVDLAAPGEGCRRLRTIDLEMTVPFGWPFDSAKAPRDVVTPGIHAYVERRLAWLRARGIPAPPVPGFPGREPELPRPVEEATAGGDGGGGGGSANATAGCDCSCAGIEALMADMEGDEAPTLDMLGKARCLQQCMPQVMACGMED
ncbi:MAG: hypothetical protein RID91_12460 [Azospirillaceae bacterium]